MEQNPIPTAQYKHNKYIYLYVYIYIQTANNVFKSEYEY